MKTPNYINIKKISDFTIRQLSKEILKAYSDDNINEYLEKYSCKNVRELIYLLLCEAKPSDLNISLNMRQKLTNMSDEINQSESEDEHLHSQIKNSEQEINALRDKISSLDDLLIQQSKKVQEVIQINKTLTLKLQSKKINDLGL